MGGNGDLINEDLPKGIGILSKIHLFLYCRGNNHDQYRESFKYHHGF